MSQRVYTDGSCRRNGQPGARAAWAVFFGDNDERNASSRVNGYPQTNNVAELLALWHALDIIRERPYHKIYSIFTDSTYALNASTKWGRAWERRGWKTLSGSTVPNVRIIKEIREKMRDLQDIGIRVHFHLCPSHGRGPHGNEMADAMAREAVRDACSYGCACECHAMASGRDNY